MLAARGAPGNERWWQGALVAVPYAAYAALVAILFRIIAEISVAAVTLDLALGASLPWLLACYRSAGRSAPLVACWQGEVLSGGLTPKWPSSSQP